MTTILTPLPSLSDLFDQLRSAPADYPMQAARRARFVAEIERRNADPRSAEQIDADEWDADARATRESDRPQ